MDTLSGVKGPLDPDVCLWRFRVTSWEIPPIDWKVKTRCAYRLPPQKFLCSKWRFRRRQNCLRSALNPWQTNRNVPPNPTTSVVSREAIFFSQAFWPIPKLTPADTSSTTNISPQCFTWNTHPKRIPISSFCNQRPTTRSISPLNHVRETILFHVEHCWDQCYLQCYIARETYRQARRLNAIFSLKSTCYTIF